MGGQRQYSNLQKMDYLSYDVMLGGPIESDIYQTRTSSTAMLAAHKDRLTFQ